MGVRREAMAKEYDRLVRYSSDVSRRLRQLVAEKEDGKGASDPFIDDEISSLKDELMSLDKKAGILRARLTNHLHRVCEVMTGGGQLCA